MTQRSGLVFDTRFLAHDTGTESVVHLREGSFEFSPEPHPSSAFITRRIKEFLDGSGLSAQMHPVTARPATREELTAFHTPAYIEGIRAFSQGGPDHGPWGKVDEETKLSPGSFEAALYAAGGALNAVQAVMDGTVRNCYGLLRPPCHHATSNKALGFCVFNNTALAAHYARNVFGLKRILIVDWDAHHGNGTQEAFYDDPGVLFLSMHQQNWFPKDSGTLEQVGSGVGVGYTVNIPLPPGTGDRGYRELFEQLVVPIGRQFQPELILVTAGQDASWLDPLTTLMMSMDGFRAISQSLVDLAEEVCGGRLVMLQAGGYSSAYVPYCTAAALEPLLGVDLGIVDLYAGAPELEECQHSFSQETREALNAARAWHRQWWHI
ncbi:histone deacetylase [Ktedonobacter sp. SOSP1-52]|uniref:class II histone deacetylase n=1 Tax=Ktedonobacter sp. SOSP1-52 TaxID=2778366 RepID=UPI0019158477|nr:class II histone deacetylase [Ktedonobacter sp. SOSP1-52]GHO64547.1 histone deacetylase [Ktedonobacter sp. SOSP1-52]